MPSRLVAVLVGGTYLSLACGGCLSNEYVISKPELNRLAGLAASQRGARVHVVQELGSRKEWTVDSGDALPEEAYANDFAIYDRPEDVAAVTANLDLQLLLGGGSDGTVHGPHPIANPWRQRLPRVSPGEDGENWHVDKITIGGGVRDELVIGAIVVVAVVVLAAAGLTVTEGIRYDGLVQLHPEQPLHLQDRGGGERTVPLAALTPADVANSQEAVVMDDEAYGFRFIHRRPLDRKGFAFKVDFGALDSLCACYSAAGFASNLQFGYFPHQRLGLLATLTLGGGTSDLDHTFQRHSANLEAQAFPFHWWRLHLGAFAHGGIQAADDEFGTRTGPAWGGGAILEFALTTRLALTGRADYTIARTSPENQGWAGTSMFTAGLAIY